MPNININELHQDKSQNKVEAFSAKTSVEASDSPLKLKQNRKIEAWSGLPLKANNVNTPFYNQNEIKNSIARLDNNLQDKRSLLEMKNSMVLAASGMTAQDFSNMKNNGFLPENLDGEEFVTLADRFRIELAKGGADISMIGDIKSTALEGLAESGLERQAIESVLKKAKEITKIDDRVKEFLIKNELEPTVENVHRASFSTSDKYNYSINTDEAINENDFSKLRLQTEEIIRESGYPVNDQTLKAAKWLLSRELPLTAKSVSSLMELTDNKLIRDENRITDSIKDTVREGKAPKEAYILENTGSRQTAEAATENLENITDIKLKNAVYNRDSLSLYSIAAQSDTPEAADISLDSRQEYELVSARRNLEEIRLTMTFEASLSMARRGIHVNTASLSSLVDGLRARENQLYNALLGQEGSELISMSEKTKIYNETNTAVNSIKTAPAAIIGSFGVINTTALITLRALHEKTEQFFNKNPLESYESLMTAPRADLGDSIRKAFRNIDDILEDLGLENSESNRRAVRILGYNSLSITKESITNIKTADEVLQNTIRALTPASVARLIKDGENPLDLSLEDLNKKLSEIRSENSSRDNEGYAEFLYKLDKKEELSNEERNSYIGIYRLVNQVIKTDGAAIGFLLNQGAEVTMRNLMTAMKSRKHTGREIKVDDSFLGKESFNLKGISIINQIEMAFQTKRMQAVRDNISPYKLADIGEASYMNMSPDTFAGRLEERTEPQEENWKYVEEQVDNIQRAISSDNGVYEMLRRFDLPLSSSNLGSMSAFLSNRNSPYKRVFRRGEDEKLKDGGDRLLEDITQRFKNALGSPEAIKDAQEYMEHKAESVMNDVLLYENISYSDFISVRSGVRQIQMFGKIAGSSENYTIPVEIAGERGSLNLKMVRGKENKGVVEIAFNMEATGAVWASFKANTKYIYGNITVARGDMLNIMKNNEKHLISELSDVSGLEAFIEYKEEKELTETKIYEDKTPDFEITEERSSVATSVLYNIAKVFVGILGEIEL